MKLSKFELDIVANRATDILESKHQEANKELLESNEYKNFETIYTDPVVEKLKVYVEELETLERKAEILRKEAQDKREQIVTLYKKNVKTEGYFYGIVEDVVRKYLDHKKKELYPNAEFNRQKEFNRISAEIFLSPLKTPTEYLNSISSNN